MAGLILGQLAWLLFLDAIATALEGQSARRFIRAYALFFAVWAGLNLALAWTNLASGHNRASQSLAGINLLLVFAHYVGMIIALETIRHLLQESLGNGSRTSQAGNNPYRFHH